MNSGTVFVVIVALSLLGFFIGRRRSVQQADGVGGIAHLHSLPRYYGMSVALWTGLPAIFLFAGWLALEPTIVTKLAVSKLPAEMQQLESGPLSLVINDLRLAASSGGINAIEDPQKQEAARFLVSAGEASTWLKAGMVLLIALAGIAWGYSRIQPQFRARRQVESVFKWLLLLSSMVAILTTVGIVASVLFESVRFFGSVPASEFLFGLNWSPQMAMRIDQVGSSGSFGAIPLFVGTLLISAIAMIIAVPVGLMSAIYLSEYASSGFRSVAKPMLEILAGIPTVVYGFFAALTVAPFIREFGESLGLSVASESALAAGLVMGVMIIPFVSSLSDDVIKAVPQAMRDGSLGMGATKSETIRQVVLPAALPGIVGGILLAVSRAIGETMIVLMAAGLAANLSVNPLDAVTTVTAQIVTLLTGDQEFDSPKTLAAFALALMLFVVTLFLNVIALHVVRKYREQYE